MTSYDYELNFYRNGNDIRQSYLAKLVSTKVWTPNMKPKQHNSIIIFDWDDTLLPTSFLTPGGTFNENDYRISFYNNNEEYFNHKNTFEIISSISKNGVE